MSTALRSIRPAAMASPWRRRRLCILVADRPVPAALRQVSASGAFLETNARPAIGSAVELHHPDAGIVAGTVRALQNDGVAIGFECSEKSMAFALAAITADMSRRPAD